MSAAYADLYLEQGATFSTTITIDDVYNNAFDLTRYTANSVIRKSYYSTNASAVFSTVISIGNGTLTLNMTPNVTSNIAAGTYVYDAVIRDGIDNLTIRILEGKVFVSPSVTR